MQCTSRFVFRLDQDRGEHRIRLTISGEIGPECSEVLETCCEQALKEARAVQLILDVTSIDESGRALLRRLAAKGVRLVAKGMYHSYLVDSIRQAARRDSDSRSGTPLAPSRQDAIWRK